MSVERPLVYRWDLDKTYLRTEFDRAADQRRIAVEKVQPLLLSTSADQRCPTRHLTQDVRDIVGSVVATDQIEGVKQYPHVYPRPDGSQIGGGSRPGVGRCRAR